MTEPNTELPRLAPGTYLLTKRVVVKEDGLSEFVDEPEGEYIKGFWPRTRTRVTPVVDEETNLKPEAPQVSMEELKERIASVVDDYTAGEDYGSGPTRYYLTVGTPDELTAHLAAVLFPGLDWLFKAVADWQALWDEKEEWEKAAKEAWQRENVLSWLHAEAIWHTERHRAQAAADLQKIAVAMHLKPTAGVDSIVHWAENHIDSIRGLALERDKVWEVLLPLLEQHPLSKDDVQDDELRERRRTGELAELAADVLRWQADEIERLRERVHEVVDETQRRFAPYQSRCDRFDVWSKWAREMYERVGGRWGSESEATRLVVQSLLQERDEALAALEKQQAVLAEAVVIPDDARTEIRNAIANPAGQKLKREQVGDQRETVASWGARAVLKLMESWRAEATRVEEVGAVVEAGGSGG